jgi:hypothetical protein
MVRVLSSDLCHTIFIRITDVEFSSFDQLSEELSTKGFPAHLTNTQKRVLLFRFIHSCYNGHKDFDDSSVVFLIRFQSFKRFGNTRMSCCARLTVENLLGKFSGILDSLRGFDSLVTN